MEWSSPSRLIPSSPSKEMLIRSRRHFEEKMSSAILQQESLHAASKKPRRSRFFLEADTRLQGISDVVLKIRKRVLTIQSDLRILETKVNRLDILKEQACFFMTPKRILSTALDNTRSPVKLSFPPTDVLPDSSGFMSPPQSKLVEYLRRKKIIAIHMSKIWDRIGSEKRLLENIFENNITILRYKRAEKSLVKMIKVQSRLKILTKEFEGLEERLLSDDASFQNDSGFNESN